MRQFSSEDLPAGSLQFAIFTLENADLAARTVTPKPKAGQEVGVRKVANVAQHADCS